MNFEEQRKLHSYITDNLNRKCKCGHSVLVIKDKNICSHCGKYVFKNKEN